MRPTVSEQLEGIARILGEVVAPEVAGAYPAEILAAAVDTLEALAAGHGRIDHFVEWEASATSAVLALAGLAVADSPGESPDERHRRVRGLLESNMAAVTARPEAAAALVHLFRERIERFPLTARGWRAHPPR